MAAHAALALSTSALPLPWRFQCRAKPIVPSSSIAFTSVSPRLHFESSAALRRLCNRLLVSGEDCRCSPTIRSVSIGTEDQLGSAEPIERELTNKYYFVVANAKFMLDEEEHFKEQLFERLRHYGEKSKEQDFWLVIEPRFLEMFPDITKRLNRPAVALVSTNGPWITSFMKLRLDRVLTAEFKASSLEDALDSNPVDLKFTQRDNWTAPYPKYEFGWWETFLPPATQKGDAA